MTTRAKVGVVVVLVLIAGGVAYAATRGNHRPKLRSPLHTVDDLLDPYPDEDGDVGIIDVTCTGGTGLCEEGDTAHGSWWP